MDTLIVTLSDMHSGSTTALFPNRFWQGEHNNHTPTQQQKSIWEHFEYCAKLIKQKRNGKKLIVVHDGDALEGVHHGSLQAITMLKNEQVEIHTDLMDYFLSAVGFTKRTDKLYYTLGTEVHTDDNEELCADDLGAEENPEGGHVFGLLELTVNKRLLWFTHHGPTSGKGANQGNAFRNFLRDIFFDTIKNGDTPPDFVVTGHVHDPLYQMFVQNYKDSYHVVHGIINPSWQMKTRFAYKVAPVTKNKIGLSLFEITSTGDIRPPLIPVMI
jgi:hypothetical protein